MKRVAMRAQAREDWRAEVRYYRREAGTEVAKRLVGALEGAVRGIERNPGIGSPALGLELRIPGLRVWLVGGFPLSIWYFERDDLVDVVRIVGQRQDAEVLAMQGDTGG